METCALPNPPLLGFFMGLFERATPLREVLKQLCHFRTAHNARVGPTFKRELSLSVGLDLTADALFFLDYEHFLPTLSECVGSGESC